jgi:hypothetical protein
MNHYVYVAVFRDEAFEENLKKEVGVEQEFSICFEHEKIEADSEEKAYDEGYFRLMNRIDNNEEGYIKYRNQKIINDYVVNIGGFEYV